MTTPPDRVPAAIALGSNLGDREASLRAALAGLHATPGIEVLAASTLHETDPVGPGVQGRYLNAAAVLRTTLPPDRLLAEMLDIERRLGRVRSDDLRWGPRTIDLDLLLYGDRVIATNSLEVPHPRMTERRFVLAPLAEVAGEWVVPGTDRTVSEHLRSLDGLPD